MIRYVKYWLPYRLPCANAVRTDVIIGLQSADLVVQPEPSCYIPITTIFGNICQAFTTCDGCGRQIWNYTFSYEDSQLTNPTTPLVYGDITGVFCEDTLTDWVTQQIGCLRGES